MLSLSDELDKLQQADAHILEAVRRIELQQTLIASMPAGSGQRTRADELLATMQTTLSQFMFHRDAIIENLARLRQRDATPAR